MTLCGLVGEYYLHSENGGSIFLRKVGKHLHDIGRPQYESSSQRKPQLNWTEQTSCLMVVGAVHLHLIFTTFRESAHMLTFTCPAGNSCITLSVSLVGTDHSRMNANLCPSGSVKNIYRTVLGFDSPRGNTEM
jgi:hypothetical protein